MAPARRATANDVKTAASVTWPAPMPTARTMIRIENEPGRLIGHRRRGEKPTSPTHGLDGLAAEMDQRALNPVSWRLVKEVAHPVDDTVTEAAEPAGARLSPENQPRRHREDDQCDNAGKRGSDGLCCRRLSDGLKCNGRDG